MFELGLVLTISSWIFLWARTSSCSINNGGTNWQIFDVEVLFKFNYLIKIILGYKRLSEITYLQESARDHDRVSESFQSPKVESRNPSSRSRSRSPIPDFSILSPGPGPESRIFWFCVPVLVPDFLRDLANPSCPFVPLVPDFRS